MTKEHVVRLTRKELYDDVWRIPVSGIAQKYNISYTTMLNLLKNARIPLPPSGYWMKKDSNEKVTATPLPGNPNEIIELHVPLSDFPKYLNEQELIQDSPPLPQFAQIKPQSPSLSEPEIQKSWNGKERNVYHREILYQEVWSSPMTKVAEKYAISDVALKKVCKSLDIPTPPPGYWSKLRAGQKMEIPPLPESKKRTTKIGTRTGPSYKMMAQNYVSQLPEQDRTSISAVTSRPLVTSEGQPLNPKVASYKAILRNDQHNPLRDDVSEDSIPRILKILDSLAKAAEPLGITIEDDLNFAIGPDRISLKFSETMIDKPHELTKTEEATLKKYETDLKHGRLSSKPKIRNKDRVYTGQLALSIGSHQTIRETKKHRLEDSLGDALIIILSAISQEKSNREKREEEERKFMEEKRRKAETKAQLDLENAKTNMLLKLANDYETACKIRNLIAAVEASAPTDIETRQWITWAKGKADFYDPTLGAIEKLLGKNEQRIKFSF